MSIVKCVNCSGFGIVDAGYHNPVECKYCNGTGHLYQDKHGRYRSYNGRYV